MADFVLRITSGPMAGQIIPLDNEFSVGRAETGHGNLGDDSQLSRHHARFRRLDTGQVLVEDLGSTNGTQVNGERIAAPRILGPGDTVTLGRTTLEFHADSEAGTDAAHTAGAAPVPGAGAPAAAVPAAAAAAGAGFQAPPAAAAGAPGTGARSGEPLHPSVQSGGIRGRMIAAIGLLVLLVAGAVVAVVLTTGGKDKTACNRSIYTSRSKAGPGHFIFQTSACENSNFTVATLNLHKGTSNGKTVWYVITETSDRAESAKLGVNFAPKLKNAIGSGGIMNVTMNSDGTVNFPATISFGHKRVLVPGPTDFPPAKASPAAFGEPTYSPFIKLPNGMVMNAPQVANDSGRGPKVVSIDKGKGKVKYLETEGRYEDKVVHYMSFDAGSPVAATLENVDYAPALQKIPAPGKDELNDSAREVLIAFVNGPVGKNNPQRQGLNSVVHDGMDPLNILRHVPELPHHPDIGDIRYAPMWDVHLAMWTADAIASGSRSRIAHRDDILSRQGDVITSPTGAPKVGASGFDVNCPVLSIDVP